MNRAKASQGTLGNSDGPDDYEAKIRDFKREALRKLRSDRLLKEITVTVLTSVRGKCDNKTPPKASTDKLTRTQADTAGPSD